MTRVLVTGASGFIGRRLCETLTHSGYVVRAALRDGAAPLAAAECVAVGDIVTAEWTEALRNVQCVVHAAARAHRVEAHGDADLCLRTNADATLRLARAAVVAGVNRFVYLSSVKVNGEGRQRPYRASDEPCPQDPYGRSKWFGEQHAFAAAAGSATEVAVVRSPLVFGPGVRANFLRLMSWVEKGRPLPLAAINNRRSLVSVWNLCDLLRCVLTHAAAPGRVWMVSDGEDLATPELVRRIATAMNRRARLYPVPAMLLRVIAVLSGRSAEMARLCDSLTVDIAPTVAELGWSPPLATAEALARTAAWYLSGGIPHAS
jgi:nucleoside-diphosphate-sugar epimerase